MRSRAARVVERILGGLVLVALVAYAYVGWRASGELLVPRINPVFDVRVLAVDDETITLTRTARTEAQGLYGFEFPDGYAQVSEVLAARDDGVERRYTPVEGLPEPDQRGRIDRFAFDGTPEAVGLSFERVHYDSETGSMPAWRTAGTRTTWVIYVHDHDATREEALRVLPLFASAGLPTLTIAYREDVGAPSGNGLHGLGWNEWRDLHGAAAYALDQGATDLVLVGSGFGGEVVTMFLHESRFADDVRGVILDSPVLDVDATARLLAEQRGLPLWCLPAATAAAYVREGIRLGALDQVARADDLASPILLLHGDADTTTPVAVSEAFAAARPDLVTFVGFEGVDHGDGWNAARERYEGAIRDFLARVAPSG